MRSALNHTRSARKNPVRRVNRSSPKAEVTGSNPVGCAIAASPDLRKRVRPTTLGRCNSRAPRFRNRGEIGDFLPSRAGTNGRQ